MMMRFLPENTQALIFDVDGTLYDQGKLRRRMFFKLLNQVVTNHRFVWDVNVLYTFRKKRERLSRGNNDIGSLENRQYAEVARELGIRNEDVQRVINEWIYEKPLSCIADYIYEGVTDLFTFLKAEKIKIGVFSDYPCHAKLQALGLYADVMISSTDEEVNRFKPDPRGLLLTAERLCVPVKHCFFIGDRDDKDGECARRVGMPYLILSRDQFPPTDWYRKVKRQIHNKESSFI